MPEPSLSERLTEQFYAWELRGRGWQEFPHPIALEPPFRPFPGYGVSHRFPADDGRRETFLSALASRMFGKDREPPGETVEVEPPPEPEPEAWGSDAPLIEIGITLPGKAGVSTGLSEALLLALGASYYPLSFEILGLPDCLSLQFAARLPDRDRVVHQLRAFFPDAVLSEERGKLRVAWQGAKGDEAVLEFGLGREFMLPLRTVREFRPDPLLSILGALSEVRTGELGLVQVLFAPVLHPWAESVIRAVHTPRGQPFFLDAPELTSLAKEKVSHPLVAALVRIGAKGGGTERAWGLLSSVAGSLAQFSDWNELVPLAHEEEVDLVGDLLARTAHRTGMLLSVPELAAMIHLPHESVRLPKLRREVRPTKPPPPIALGEGVTLGENIYEGERVTVRLPRDLRMRHVHVIGASGTGKSTLLTRMLLEDIERGEGVGLIDPHGDLVDEILARFPEHRERDLILFDPGDEEVALGWNMLQAATEIEKTLLASDLVGVFRRLSTSWGDQMNSVLANAILAFLESERGGTLLDLRRFLVDREFRAEFLRTVRDSEVLYYWQKEFPLLVGKPQGPILTRLDTFLRPKLVRRVVVERGNRLDFRKIVDGGQVFLAKLSQGAIGEENAALLGSLLVSAFHQAAISRQDLAPGSRRHFFLYLDEFQEFATPSMAALLSGARKYRLGLTLAHQELRQLEARDREVSSALLGNAATRIVFRVGEDDARNLERGFSSFAAQDLVNLGVGEAISRVERSEHDFNLQTSALPPLEPKVAEEHREMLLALTRTKFPRSVEEEREAEPASPSLQPAWKQPEPRDVPPPAPPREKRAPREPEPVPALGRGGKEHQYLQELVKRWGESRGFRVVIEKPILDGKGSVDVVLERGDFSLACEISVTTGVEHEAGNAVKCLAAGFDRVALISLKKDHLARLRAALARQLREDELSRLLFLAPEELSLFLDTLPPPAPNEERVGGYRVKVEYEMPDEAAQASRARAIADLIARRTNQRKRP